MRLMLKLPDTLTPFTASPPPLREARRAAGLLYHYLGAGEPETFVMDGEEILFDGAAMTWADPGGWVLSSLSQKIDLAGGNRSEEHTSELQSLMRISYAVFCLKKKTHHHHQPTTHITPSPPPQKPH